MKRQSGFAPVSLLKVLLVLIISLFAWANLHSIRQSLADPFHKDLQAEYLLAKALANGVNPYLPLSELAKRWLPEMKTTAFVHPTPHPFAIGWLSLPLAALSFPTAAKVWLGFELVCLVLSVVLWLRVRRRPVIWWQVCLGSFALLAWHPLALELFAGQLSLVLLPLFLLAWLALRAGREVTGGLYLGGLVVLKMAGLPILLWLAWQRRWRAVAAAAALWTAAHLLAIELHGWAMVRDYYFKVGPQVSAFYRLSFANLSVWTLGQRLFGEMNWKFVSVPWWDAPWLVPVLTVLLPVLVLAGLVFVAQRARRFETGFALLMGGGLFLTPVAWVHYFVLALPAFYLVFQRLGERGWPRWRTGLVVLSAGAISISEGLYFNWVEHFFAGQNAEGLPLVGALPALLTLIPLAAVSLLLWQMVALESPLEEPQDAAAPMADWQAATVRPEVLASP